MTDDVHEWLAHGEAKGWISPVVCETHEGAPTSEEEDEEFGEGGDPCVFIVRVYAAD